MKMEIAGPVDRDLASTRERMEARRAALTETLSEDFQKREDALPNRVRSDNASAQAKLGKIYALVDEFSTQRAAYVACQRGCAACCKMNVQISNVEAARIQVGTGRRPRALTRSVSHAEGKYEGEACPFLVDEACSIYEHRPLACRTHASFDVDAYWCAVGRMNTATLPMLELGGAKQALFDLLRQQKQPVMADIRDFFPAAEPAL